MRMGAKIAVIVPAFNEQALIVRTLSSLPEWVDAICVVDDASRDETRERVLGVADPRIQLLTHPWNIGVGGAIATGYRAALAAQADILVVMAGDNQMDPSDLAGIVQPILEGHADYVKGNRFEHAAFREMPLLRRVGGRYLSALTRLATGLRVGDTQCGYTALTAKTLERLPLDQLWPSFGYPNDLLAMLAAAGSRVIEVPVRPVYADEESGMRPWHVLTITRVIGAAWLKRSFHRNVHMRTFVVDPIETRGDSQARES